jgi:hypothetical protein
VLGTGTYSLVLSLPNSSPDFIYENVATASNTPDGSLGGTRSPAGLTGGNLVFELDGNLTSSAIPEPGTLSLLLAPGLLAAWRTYRTRRTRPGTRTLPTGPG